MIKKIFWFLFFALLVAACDLFAQNPVRVRMPTANYSAQFRGVASSTTTGIIVQGAYDNKYNAHEFLITTTGPYELWGDPAGGSTYVEDTDWGLTNGKWITGSDHGAVASGAINPIMFGAIAGDSNSDITAFQAAADSINSKGGGILEISPGAWNFGVLANGDSVRLYSNTKVLCAPGAVLVGGAGSPIFKIDGDSLITIDGCEFDGQADIVSGFTEFDHAIHVANANKITIKNIYAHDMAGDGVYFADVDDSQILNSFFNNPHLQNSPYIGRNCVAVVEGVGITISNIKTKYGGPAAIDIEPNAGLTVENVDIINVQIDSANTVAGINLDASAASSVLKNIRIRGGSISKATQIGIRVNLATDWTIENVEIFEVTFGTYILDNTVDGNINGNRVHNNSSKGITLLSGHNNIGIKGNYVWENVETGIVVDGSSGSENHYITIDNNTVWNNDSAISGAYVGIRLDYTDSSTVKNNHSFDFQATPSQTYGYNFTNCDVIDFSTTNTGFGNVTNLFRFNTVTGVTGDNGRYVFADQTTDVLTGPGIREYAVVVTDAAEYDVLAANTGKIHLIGDLSQNTSIDLPAEVAGLSYEFWYVGAAAEAHDHTFDSENDTNYLIGGVSFLDNDAGSGADEVHAGVYSDGNSNSKLTVNNAAAGTKVKITCDGTNWYVTGIIISDTVPAFADQ